MMESASVSASASISNPKTRAAEKNREKKEKSGTAFRSTQVGRDLVETSKVDSVSSQILSPILPQRLQPPQLMLFHSDSSQNNNSGPEKKLFDLLLPLEEMSISKQQQQQWTNDASASLLLALSLSPAEVGSHLENMLNAYLM